MPFTIKKIAMRLRNDSEYIPLPGVRGEAGPGVPAGGTTGQVLAKTSSTDYATGWVDAGSSSSLTILSYGHSTWSDFIAAYNSRSIVYCRASSDSDPASGSQTRLAFMAYVNSAASPTSVEFQYYRSVSSHTDAQQGDQVFIYKLTSAGAWTVTVRDAFTKIVAGTNMTSSYSSGTLTLNATGGGGGTSDYDDLADKPSINDVTLSGNKTAAELGLGTYSKPSGGIPKTDLASTVQTSLGLADSALQSVPSTYRTAAAQDSIDAAQDAQIEAISHRNLLDNWYFVGGGSQLGAGVFPINQRGQSSYSAAGYGVDRWSCATSSVTVLCGYNNYIILKSSTAVAQNLLIQYIDNKELLAGKTVTISAIINGVLVQSTISIPADSSTWGSTIGSGSGPVGGCAIYLRYLNSKLCFVFYASSTYTANTNILIKAAKLELGPYQTLAHNEGTESSPNWVLNEIPDYGEELEKCRRYFRVLESTPGDGNGQYFAASRGYSDAAYINVAVEPPMMANIVPSLPDGIQGAAIDGAGTSANLSGVQAASSNKSFGIRAASNLARTPIVVYLNKRIYLSAES